jgi:hypothetical protein
VAGGGSALFSTLVSKWAASQVGTVFAVLLVPVTLFLSAAGIH